MKIRTKLGILPIALAVIMLTVSLLITILISNNTVKNQIGNHLLSTAQSRAHNIETLLNDYKEVVHTLAVGIPFTNVFDTQIDYTKRMNECNLRIKRTIESYPDISTISILNKNGIVISSSNEDIGYDLSKSDIFTKGKENVYIADIHKSEHTGNLILSISSPIFLRETFSGVMIINFGVEKRLFKILTDTTGLGKTGEIYLVNKDGIMLSPSRFIDVIILKTKINTKQVKLFLSEHLVKGLPENTEQKPTNYLDYRGKKVLGVHFYISEMQWVLIAEFDVEEVYKPINKQAILLITIFLVLFLAVLFFAFKLSKGITSPIIKLHEGTKEIIKGNLDHKIGVGSKDEIGELFHSFDIMTGRLKKSQNKIDRHTEVLKTTVKERTAELEKQFEKSEKQRIATLVVMNDLNKNTKELKEEIIERKRAEQIQKVLYNISNAVTTTNTLKKLISKIRKEMGTIIDTTNFYIAFYDKKSDMLSLPYYADEKDKFTYAPAAKTLTKYVIETKKPLLANVELKKKFVKEGKLEHQGSVSKIWLGVPLKIEGKITGVLAVQSYTDENAFDESDMEMLEFVSDQISISIERKKAEEELAKHRDHLEELVNERTLELEKSQNSLTLLLDDVNDINKELQKTNTKLDSTNKEMEAFSYSVSHDLRAPLTRMDGFSQAILDTYSDKLDEQGKHFLNRIRSSSQHMAKLIDDMLALSRISRKDIFRQQLDLTQLAENISEELMNAEPKRKVNFKIKKGLKIKADQKFVIILLQNLLGNAYKFTGKNKNAVIEFGTKTIDKKEVFFIKDNGAGFNMKYYNKIFTAFQRLHHEDDFKGTGIGLAIVQRIINKHGGEIWAESEKGKGSVFYFHL